MSLSTIKTTKASPNPPPHNQTRKAGPAAANIVTARMDEVIFYLMPLPKNFQIEIFIPAMIR
jgi:hypothetical protein